MRRNGRWWLAGALTLAAFLVITWGTSRYLPVSWLKDPTQRLTVGSGAGLAVAGLVALWGKSFATAQASDAHHPQAEATAANSGSHAERTVTIKGDSTGIASAGDHVRNIQGPQARSDMPAKTSRGSGSIWERQAVRKSQVRIEGNNAGIASAGDDTTNIQETR